MLGLRWELDIQMIYLEALDSAVSSVIYLLDFPGL